MKRRFGWFARHLIFALVLTALAGSAVFAFGNYPIYGIHFYGTGAENTIKNGMPMWSVEMFYTNHYHDWNLERAKLQDIKNKGFKIILRLDYDIGLTVPYGDSGYWDWQGRYDFAQQCRTVASQVGDLVDAFVIGNEIGGGSTTPVKEWYTIVFNGYDSNCVYDQIKAVRPNAVVCLYAPCGWASNDNIQYWEYVVDNIDKDGNNWPQVDGFALHAYSGASTIYDSNCEDPRFASKYDFRGWQEYATRIYQRFGPWKPIYITETNTQWYFGQWDSNPLYSQDSYRAAWLKEAFQAINEWNQANDQKVDALCWYVYQHQCVQNCDQYENSLVRTDNWRLNNARSDLSWCTANTYYIPGYPGSTLHFEAENYTNSDEAGARGATNGLSGTDYYDTTTGNSGGEYRSENVDVGRLPTWDGFFVGWTAAGEWTRYTSLSGNYNYKIRVRYARGAGGSGQVRFIVDGTTLGGTNYLPSTGNWNTYTTYTSSQTFYMGPGQHEIKMYHDTGLVNVDWFEFVKQ